MSDSVKEAPTNFWGVCPLKKEYLPTEVCSYGVPSLDSNKRTTEDPKCEWWINSKDHNYCFWRFINDRSDPDGLMKEILQSDLAKLFGCSSTKIHFILREAIQELTAALEDSNLKNQNVDDAEQLVDIFWNPEDFDDIEEPTD